MFIALGQGILTDFKFHDARNRSGSLNCLFSLWTLEMQVDIGLPQFQPTLKMFLFQRKASAEFNVLDHGITFITGFAQEYRFPKRIHDGHVSIEIKLGYFSKNMPDHIIFQCSSVEGVDHGFYFGTGFDFLLHRRVVSIYQNEVPA